MDHIFLAPFINHRRIVIRNLIKDRTTNKKEKLFDVHDLEFVDGFARVSISNESPTIDAEAIKNRWLGIKILK